MRTADRVRHVVLIALAAALIAGSVTGTQLTIEDDAWPARGGYEAVLQMSVMFGLYALAVALPVGLIMSFTLSPLLKDEGPLTHILGGAAAGFLVHLGVVVAIGERIDSSEDFLGGTLAGAVSGYLWWRSVQRHERKVISNG